MKCPNCHKNGSRVVDSRPADNGHAIEDAENVSSVDIDSQHLRESK